MTEKGRLTAHVIVTYSLIDPFRTIMLKYKLIIKIFIFLSGADRYYNNAVYLLL